MRNNFIVQASATQGTFMRLMPAIEVSQIVFPAQWGDIPVAPRERQLVLPRE
jgi:hypothetical protein